jgi:hypothetical protein
MIACQHLDQIKVHAQLDRTGKRVLQYVSRELGELMRDTAEPVGALLTEMRLSSLSQVQNRVAQLIRNYSQERNLADPAEAEQYVRLLMHGERSLRSRETWS